MSEAYERERQNDASLALLSQKVSALRGVTVDIYDQARDQGVLDASSEVFSGMSTSIRSSGQRFGRAVKAGDTVGVLKLVCCLVAAVLVLYWLVRVVF